MTANLSGEYELDLTVSRVINDALELLQTTGQGEDTDGNIAVKAKRTLNKMLKMWEAQGIHLWCEEEYTLFLKKGQRIYDLNLAATRCVNGEEWQSAQLAADAAASATSISVDSVTNAAIGRAIGILNNSNDIQWTVIERIDGTTLHLKDALTTAADENRYVRMYDTADLGTTTLSALEAIGQTTLSVSSIVGIAANYVAGILQDDNSVLWTTVNSVDADNNTITVNDALTVAASSGNAVIFYSSEQNYTPISRIGNLDAVRRHSGESSDYEIPIHLQSREDYMQLPNKEQEGTVIQSYFSQQQPQGKFYVWNAPGSAVEYLNFTAEREIQLVIDNDDTFDLPSEWFDALVYNLARRMIPIVGCSPERKADIRSDAADYLSLALSFDSDIYPIRMDPQQDYG